MCLFFCALLLKVDRAAIPCIASYLEFAGSFRLSIIELAPVLHFAHSSFLGAVMSIQQSRDDTKVHQLDGF